MAPTKSSQEPAEDPSASERAWLDVIQKMDEVYHDLLEYEVALERKNSALEESQQFIFSVLSSMSDILIVCNRTGAIEDVNPSLLALTGRDEAQLRGSLVFELFADAESRRCVQHHFVDNAAQPLHDCEVNMSAANGTQMPVSINGMPRLSATGKLQGVVLTGRPVGELRRAYQSLRQAHDDLKRTQQQLLHSEKIASLGRLVAGVAHELNNPISFVLGNVVALQRYVVRLRRYCECLHGGGSVTELTQLRDELLSDLPSLIEGTVEGAERTRDIVAALKRFSAVDRDELEPIDLVPVLERAAHWVGNAAPAQVQIQVNLPARIEVLGSAGQLQQVFMNLVQNAVDATAALDPANVHIRALEVGPNAVVEFTDNGPGIPPENLGRVFDPFFTTKPVGQGTGLGLAISYGIIERHGGQISVANRPEGGAIFKVELPLSLRQTN
jgi:two-component system sensor histidine kinase HupT/HoxJ